MKQCSGYVDIKYTGCIKLMKSYLKTLRKFVGTEEVIINCAAAWVENERGVLLERRGDDGNWGLIGGVMDLGESPKDTVLREFKEETGIDARLGELIGVYTRYRHVYPSGDRAQLVVFFFECLINPDHDIVVSDESLEIRYFERESLPVLGMPQHQQMASDALAGTRNYIE